jgi:hypothetical protein
MWVQSLLCGYGIKNYMLFSALSEPKSLRFYYIYITSFIKTHCLFCGVPYGGASVPQTHKSLHIHQLLNLYQTELADQYGMNT